MDPFQNSCRILWADVYLGKARPSGASCPATFRRPVNFDPRSHLRDRMPFIQSDYQIDVWIDMTIEDAEQAFAPWRVATEPQSAENIDRKISPVGTAELSPGRSPG
jgi:hypothetical protein